MKRTGKIEVVYNLKGRRRWHYRVKAGNGEILVASELYTRKATAIRQAKKLNVTMKYITNLYVQP
jgi:uncharacterized protein YegP (UPF0339 family)